MRALFLDRDGIINVDYGYVSTIEKFEFSRDIFEFLKLFIQKDYKLFIVTNQSGIGRGYYTLEDFHTLTRWMIERLKSEGISIEEVYYCPHAPELNCHCRKPSIGMIESALDNYPLELDNSWIVGDKESDIALGDNAMIANSIFIGATTHPKATLSFESISEANIYFQANKEMI
jgi:D-glycero-D-manno-heptose 1,7-bisphosphate phosphatase